MGCGGSNYDPFSADGTEIDEGHARRMKRIVEACAERDMVVVVGIFYQHAPFGLADAVLYGRPSGESPNTSARTGT